MFPVHQSFTVKVFFFMVSSTPYLQDDQKFLTKARRENQVVNFQHIKILLTGSAAVGKTSFCRLLFQSKFSDEYKSTEIMETKQAISIVNFTMLQQKTNKKEIVWLKLDAKHQVEHFKSLLQFRVFYHNESEELLKDDASVLSENFTLEAEDNDAMEIFVNNFVEPEALSDVESKVLSSEPLCEDLTINKEVVKLITVIDSGGQPEYIHMLPAINTCPTINFIVHDMTKGLDDQVMVRYKSRHDKTFKDYPLQYSNLDMIGLLMSLTTDSLEQPMRQAMSTRVSIPSTSYIGFIGTHKDKLGPNQAKKIKEIDDRLTQVIEERQCRFAVLPAADDGVLFPVDNTTAGDSESEDPVVKSLRQKVEDFMDKVTASNTTDNQLPITWMLLELELQEMCENKDIKYITCEEYAEIATKKASIVAEEVEESLQHFNYLGVLLHFKEVSGLCNYVIVDHQWLFDSLAMIMHLSAEDIKFHDHCLKKMYDKQRLLPKNQLQIVEWKSGLPPEYFFELLVHLKIIATVLLNDVEYYYMPCILSSTKQYDDKYRFLQSEPLLVQFSSGFLPRGFFCSLVVHLLQDLPDGWEHQLHNTEHFSNVATFRLPDKSYLRLHDKTSYLEVQVRHYERDADISYHPKLFNELQKYFVNVCAKLNFNREKLQYGFLCHEGYSNDDHISVIKSFQIELPEEVPCCRKPPHQTRLGNSHRIWFNKV